MFTHSPIPRHVFGLLAASVLACGSATANAAIWSDNAISWRYGEQFGEPFNTHDIRKNILAYTHVSGYEYGTNFLNIDLLLSDKNDPKNFGSNDGAEETYLVYRHTLDIGKLSGREIRFGPVRGLGLTAGIDLNRKEDKGYNSRKRMWVVGPTLMLDVPGFLDVSLLWLGESNDPSVSSGAFDPGFTGSRYRYDNHAMLGLSWGIPIADSGFNFNGFANFIDSKGKDELGRDTASETNITLRMMYTFPQMKSLRAGLEYQYWQNKFGNSDKTVGALGGNDVSTPMIRVEYHF